MSIPTCSPEGWVDSPENMMVKMFHYACESDHSQSSISLGTVFSIRKVMAENATKPDDVKMALLNGLKSYYSRVFSDVKVSIDYTDTGDNDITYNVDISGRYNNNFYRLSDTLSGISTDSNKSFKREFFNE